ncbi:hypothetical protein [Hydrogenophaga sp. ANAO-22]|uniref:hypothetical protein n=1 Tax=Hydrogenophaga sp. ANAO-22 TaxID=3166645 RepID=UPI0036D35C54
MDLIARNGDARSRAGRPPSSDLAMVDVGCGDASSRSVATAGDLVPSSAMAMLQLDVRGLVVAASSDAAMLERGEKKTASGCPRRQVCMRFREEETAPAIREENRAA